MAKQKKEDNRDIFEKIMDAAPMVAGAYLGARAGNSAGRFLIRGGSSDKMRRYANQLAKEGKHEQAEFLRSHNFSANVTSSPFTAAGGLTGAILGNELAPSKKYTKRRK